MIEQRRPISLPTDGLVYDPELAHCCSCEPQREAEIAIKIEKHKADQQMLQHELERRRKLLDLGILDPFVTVPVPVPAPAPGP